MMKIICCTPIRNAKKYTYNFIEMKMKGKPTTFMTVLALVILYSLTGTIAKAQNGIPKAKWNARQGTLDLFFVPAGSIISYPMDGSTLYDITTYSSSELPPWSGEQLKMVTIQSSFEEYQPKSTAYWFYNCKNLTSIEGMGYLDTGAVTDMSYMFSGCESLTSLDVSAFDTRNVTSMSYMFGSCRSVEHLDLSDFNTSNVTDMSYMFAGCNSLKDLDLSSFDTGSVTLMSNMFHGCILLTDLDLSGFITKKVKKMSYMFFGCNKLQTLNLKNFYTKDIETCDHMFYGCSSLETIYSNNNWKTSSGSNYSNMVFGGCYKLKGGKGTACDGILHADQSYAHIDEGTTNPGYFTEKIIEFNYTSGTIAYAVLNNETLTFYYDNKPNSRTGTKYQVKDEQYYYVNERNKKMPDWYSERMAIKKVVFDSSFASYRPKKTACWFYQCQNLLTLEGMANLKTDQVSDMTGMFRFCGRLESIDVSNFDTRNVTNMSFMFCYCSNLMNLDVSKFNTSKVTDMQHMFHTCTMTELDLRSFDTSEVEEMTIMFGSCGHLKTIYASDKWTTKKVKYSNYMFSGCKSLIGGKGTLFTSNHTDHEYAHIDGGLCDPGYLTGEYQTGNREPYAVLDDDGTLTFYYDFNKNCRDGIIYSEFRNTLNGSWGEKASEILKVVFDNSFKDYHGVLSTYMWFRNCANLKTVVNSINLNTENVANMAYMFTDCRNLSSVNVSQFNTQKVQDMSYMFYYCEKLSTIDVSNFKTAKVKNMKYMFCHCDIVTSLDVSGFETSNVTDMSGMFQGCMALTKLDVSHFETGRVNNMKYMFYGCSGVPEIDVSHFDTKNVTDMRDLFSHCSSLQHVDVTNFDTNKVTDMCYMFYGCESLKEVDVTNFDTQNVTNIRDLFSHCPSLEHVDLTHFITSKVTDMSFMFWGCNKLNAIDLTHFDTSNVTDMQYMFYDCTLLKEIDMSSFNTHNVTCTDYMFYACSNITTIYASNMWTRDNISDGSCMFTDCFNLVGGAGTRYKDGKSSVNYAHIDGGTSNPGYFTYKEYINPTNIKELPLESTSAPNEVWYNLQGVRVEAPSKGIYIVNGKKVVRK